MSAEIMPFRSRTEIAEAELEVARPWKGSLCIRCCWGCRITGTTLVTCHRSTRRRNRACPPPSLRQRPSCA